MSNETDGQGETPKPPPSAEPGPRPTAPGSIEQRIVGIANDWLKTRLGLEERPDGTLELPQRGAFENIGEKADQFMRGFFRGFIEKTPEEREAQAGLRDPATVPNATEVAGRLLSRASAAVTGAFHDYLKEAVPPPAPTAPTAAGPEPAPTAAPVHIDGRFLLRHGAPLIGRIVQALGTAFTNPSDVNAAAPGGAPAAPHGDAETRVDYRVDLPSLMKSLITGRTGGAPASAPGATAPTPTPTPTPPPATPAAGPTEPTGGERA
jgi:hypothetical protein